MVDQRVITMEVPSAISQVGGPPTGPGRGASASASTEEQDPGPSPAAPQPAAQPHHDAGAAGAADAELTKLGQIGGEDKGGMGIGMDRA